MVRGIRQRRCAAGRAVAAALQVRTFPVGHSDDCNDKLRIGDFIDDPVLSLTDPVPLLAGEFRAAPWSWVFRQGFDALQYPKDMLLWYGAEVFADRLFDAEFIVCQGL